MSEKRRITITIPQDMYRFIADRGKHLGQSLSETIEKIIAPCQKFAQTRISPADDPDLMADGDFINVP